MNEKIVKFFEGENLTKPTSLFMIYFWSTAWHFLIGSMTICSRQIILEICRTTILLKNRFQNSPSCNTLAWDEPFCGFWISRLFPGRSSFGTCRSWSTWDIGIWIPVWGSPCRCCTWPGVWQTQRLQIGEGPVATPWTAAPASSNSRSEGPEGRKYSKWVIFVISGRLQLKTKRQADMKS